MKPRKIFLLLFAIVSTKVFADAAPVVSNEFPSNGLVLANYVYSNAATSTNMAGVYEGTLNATAQYADNYYTVTAGHYLPADSEDPTTTCTSGNYCPGLQNQVTYNATTPQGLENCPSGYGNSAEGATANTECYRTCAIANNGTTFTNIAHATAVSGNDYYNTTATDTCEPTACENGWHVKAATLDLNTLIGTEKGTGSTANAMTFSVDYGGRGTITGKAQCSTRSATDPWVGTDGVYVLQSDATTTLPDSSGPYCYCMLDGYTPNGGTLQSLSSPWVFNYVHDDAGECEYYCMSGCRTYLLNDDSYSLSFRAAVFGSLGTPGPAMCEANIYNITYTMNDGTNYNNAPTTYTYGTGTTIDGVPTKSGYTFGGWCTDSELTTCAMTQTIGTTDTGNKTFYAKWTQCDACAATNASCTFDGIVNNACTYTTTCDTGYANIQNNGAYNAICSPATYNITLNNITHLPSGFTQLEYLESTGTQYIDTALTAGSDTRISAQYKLKNVSFTFPISVRDVHAEGQGFSFGVNGTQQFISDYNGDRQVFTTITPNTTDIITLDKNKNVCTVTLNGISETKINPTSTFETTGTMVFFAQRSEGNITAGRYVFYSFKMWNNGTLVRNMIPARRDSDGVLGMYDLVSNTFFTNAGTGTFVAGPTLENYTYGVGKTLDYVPTRDGYTFAGWCTDSELTTCAMTQTISTTDTGDKTYYAKWIPLYTCLAGQYLPMNANACATCTANSYCVGGQYNPSDSIDQGIVSCASGLYSPAGMWESAQCGRILHIGDEVLYLRSTKKTTPSLNIDIDNDGVPDFFGNVTTQDVVMNSGTQRKLKVRYDNTTYSIYDDTVTVDE